MVAYSFKARFAAPILAGTKRQTIREPRLGRSHHAKPGDEVQLYTGMRTKACKLIGRSICIAASPITLWVMFGKVDFAGVTYDTQDDCNDFAREDGFADWSDLVAFWRAEHPGIEAFTGQLIQWGPLL